MQEPKHEVIQALGRPFALGYLYNIRRDMVINRSLWNQSQLTEDKITRKSSESTDFKVEISNSIEESLTLMDISASLKMSFLGGLVDVSGSAKYLDKRNSTSSSTSITLMHYMTSDTVRLGEEQLSHITYPNLLDLEEATHVITGITYGANAFFKFEKEVGVNESEKDVSGSLSVAVKSIPGFQISGEGEVNMEERGKENFQNISCQFVGDYTGIEVPTDFESAVKVFKSIDKANADCERRVVPITVYLTPIHTLGSKAANLVKEISEDAVNDCSKLMSYFRDVETKLSTLKLSKTAQYFPDFQAYVEKIQGLFSKMSNLLKVKMVKILPDIRGGGTEEEKLLQMIKEFQSSIYSQEYFNGWFSCQRSEIRALDEFLIKLEKENVTITKDKGELVTKLFTNKIGVIALTSTLVSTQDPELITDLGRGDVDNPANYDYPTNKNNWMEEENFLGKLLKLQKNFLLASKVPDNKENFEFIFDLRYLTKENSCTAKFYKDGLVVEEEVDLSSSDITNIRFNRDTNQVEGDSNETLDVKKEIRYQLIKDNSWRTPTERIPKLKGGAYLAQMRCVFNNGLVGNWLPKDPIEFTVKAVSCNIKPPPKYEEDPKNIIGQIHNLIVEKIREVFLEKEIQLENDGEGPTLVTCAVMTVMTEKRGIERGIEKEIAGAKLNGSEKESVILLRIVPTENPDKNQKVEKIHSAHFLLDLPFLIHFNERGPDIGAIVQLIDCPHNTDQCQELLQFLFN